MFKFRTLNNDPDFLPVRSTRYAGAYDIKAAEDVVLNPYQPVWVPTGLWITEFVGHKFYEEQNFSGMLSVQERCYFLRIYPRSSFFKKQIYYHPGIIDEDFRDEIKVGMEWRPNPKTVLDGADTALSILTSGYYPQTLEIKAKERIAQMQAHLFYPITGALEQDTERQGGFGSTGQ